MQSAIKEAEKGRNKGEVPVGCVVVFKGEIISKAHNEVEKRGNPMNHCEILALRKALRTIGRREMSNTSLYITLEPCCMCFFSMVLLRIKELIFGADNPKFGACGSVVDITSGFNHKIKIKSGVLKEKCARLLSDFFKTLR
ncbi:MAG: nucleoside deaminase [bacterium]